MSGPTSTLSLGPLGSSPPRQQDLGWDEVDSELLSWLEQLGMQREVEGSASANAWLHALGNELPDEVIILPEDGAKRAIQQQQVHPISWANEMVLEAFPNPSNGPVFLAYTLPEGCEQGILSIADLSGRAMAKQLTYQSSGLVQITTNEWSAGLYLVTLNAGGHQTQVTLSIAP